MTDVHANFTIPAADFEAYVELTRQALQTVVPDLTVAEATQFYQIFESFHEVNSTKLICNQADCQSVETVTINGAAEPVAFSDLYIPISATSLTVDNPSTFAVNLYYMPSNSTACTASTSLQEIVPVEMGQTLALPFTETGIYYIYQVTIAATECFLNTTVFNTSVLIVDFTLPPALPPVDTPIAPPVEPPVSNVTAPIAPPVSNDTTPVTEPIAPPVNNDTVPVSPPVVEPPVTPPVAEVPVDAPVTAVPISAPVSDGNVTPSANEKFEAGGYIAGIVILVLIVIGLLIAVIVMGVKLRRNSTVVVA